MLFSNEGFYLPEVSVGSAHRGHVAGSPGMTRLVDSPSEPRAVLEMQPACSLLQQLRGFIPSWEISALEWSAQTASRHGRACYVSDVGPQSELHRGLLS